MGKFVSRHNPISARALKRKPVGTVAFHHNGNWEDVKFTRTCGGWLKERIDFFGLRSEVVSSTVVAHECNMALGCKDSWARIY